VRCVGRGDDRASDAGRQRPSLVTSVASQASECVRRGRASVATPTDASVARSA
jgi:hypothetical protein